MIYILPLIEKIHISGSDTMTAMTDNSGPSGISSKSEFSDLILAYPTLFSYVSHREEDSGTWYIQVGLLINFIN
jgi:hypothetical protein